MMASRSASFSCRRKGRDDDLDFAPPCLGQKRADGPIGQAGGQSGFLAGAAFTADKTTGILPAAYKRSS